MNPRALRIAAALGFLGVALGAFGAHTLQKLLRDLGTTDIWQKAVFYQLVHAVALLALASAGRASRVVAGLWVAGVVIFSGSLYLLAASGVKWLGVITPIGGVLLLAGWVVVAVGRR